MTLVRLDNSSLDQNDSSYNGELRTSFFACLVCPAYRQTYSCSCTLNVDEGFDRPQYRSRALNPR
jgi:hypothetical protein